MDYISNEEARQMAANHTSNKVEELEDKVNTLAIQLNNTQLEVTALKQKIKKLQEEKQKELPYYEDDTWFHPFKD